MKTNAHWYPYPSHHKFYRMVDGKLLTTPMRADGSFDESETLEVDFDAAQFDAPVDPKNLTLSDELAVIKRELEQQA